MPKTRSLWVNLSDELHKKIMHVRADTSIPASRLASIAIDLLLTLLELPKLPEDMMDAVRRVNPELAQTLENVKKAVDYARARPYVMG